MTNGIAIGLSALAGVWLGWYAVPICASIVAILVLLQRDPRYSLIIMCLLVSSAGAWRSQPPETRSTSEILALSTGSVGKVESFPRPSGDGHRMTFIVTELCISDQCIPANETVLLYAARQEPPLARGQQIRVDWRIDSLHALPPGYRGYVQSQNATASARATVVRGVQSGPAVFQWIAASNQSITDHLARMLPADTGALATGIVTGDDSALSDEAKDHFRATGTSHITAVSGQNVTIILGFLTLWWQPRTIRLRMVFHLFLLTVVWSYATFVGLEPPATRAAIVATLTILGKHVGRRPDPVTILMLTLGGMAIALPMVVHSVGFWLSATASVALCLALPKQIAKTPGKSAIQILLGPVAASLATMPIVLMTFGTWSPVSILANIIISPVITLAFWITYPFAIIALWLPGLAGLLSWMPGIVLDTALVIVKWLAPIAGQVRVDAVSPWAMLVLWLPIGGSIWLISGESDRWIRHVSHLRRRSK